ncbi:putative ribonuclease H protein, partial [Mucuna pruriens]
MAASNFLPCNMGETPFKFLGVPIGANPTRLDTWQPIIDLVRKILASWKVRYVSLGGRVVLINSVFSGLPLYFFSFFKTPKTVLYMLARMQRSFLWSGNEDSHKVAWVRWDKVYQPKCGWSRLLPKWNWRFFNDKRAIRYNILAAQYGSLIQLNTISSWRTTSWWWRDINKVEKNGRMPSRHECDEWVRKLHSSRAFTVSSIYVCLQNLLMHGSSHNSMRNTFPKFWKNTIPSKVLTNSWRLLLDRIPTRIALYIRNIITHSHETNCVLCNLTSEDTHNLFFCIFYGLKGLDKPLRLTGYDVVLPYSSANHYLQHRGMHKNSIIFQEGFVDFIQLMEFIKPGVAII